MRIAELDLDFFPLNGWNLSNVFKNTTFANLWKMNDADAKKASSDLCVEGPHADPD